MALSAILISGVAQAEPTGPSDHVFKMPERAPGPSMETALTLAHEAMRVCAADGYKVAVLVVDSVNLPIVQLTADGVIPISPEIVRHKAAASVKFKQPSSMVAERMKTDRNVLLSVITDPEIRYVFGGALPITNKGQLIGAIAVSGAPKGEIDEACGAKAIAKMVDDVP